jgi:threonine/homoserine/homoserine lactone efflux protein
LNLYLFVIGFYISLISIISKATKVSSEITFIISGIVFGLGGGLTPGPLMTLVITETLKHGTREGAKVAMVPLITDLPVVLTSIFLISKLSEINLILGIISLIGAAFLVYLGYESFIFKGVEIDTTYFKPQSLKKGIIANIFNPAPILFWISVGAPTVLKGYEVSIMASLYFVFSMYFCLVGSKLLTAILVGKSRQFLISRNYMLIIKMLGVVLFVFALVFLKDGLGLLNLI